MPVVSLAPGALLSRFQSLTRSQLGVNVVSGLVLNLAGALITVLGYRVYLQYLGYERYGLWLILSTVLVVVQLGNFGISPALQKLVAEDFAGSDIDGVYRYAVSAIVALGSGGACILIAMWLTRSWIVSLFGLSGPSFNLVYTLLPYVAALSVYVTVVDAFNSILAGLGRYDLVNYTQAAAQVITLCVSIAGLRMGWDLWSFIYAYFIAYLFLNISSLLLIRKLTRSGSFTSLRLDRPRLVRLVGFGSWVFGGSLIALLLNPINRILVARFIGVSSIPIFDIAYTSAMKIRGFLEIGFRPLIAALSEAQASGEGINYERLVSVERTGFRFVLYWGTALYLILFLTADWTLRLWLGAKFSTALPPAFRIMLAGTYFSLWGVQAYYTLLGLGRSVHIFNTAMIQLALDVGLIYLAAFAPGSRHISFEAVMACISIGMLGSTIYLRIQSARLQAGLLRPARVS